MHSHCSYDIIINGYAAVAELADALDSKSSGAIRAGSSPASGIRIKDLTEKSVRSLLYTIKKHERNKKMEKDNGQWITLQPDVQFYMQVQEKKEDIAFNEWCKSRK